MFDWDLQLILQVHTALLFCRRGCLCCPPVEQIAPMDMVIAVGFGIAQITRDGDFVYSDGDENDFPTLARFEEMAVADPDHDWRCQSQQGGDDTEAQHKLVKLVVKRVYVRGDEVVAMTLRSDYHIVLGHKLNGPTEVPVDPYVYTSGSDGLGHPTGYVLLGQKSDYRRMLQSLFTVRCAA